jgi:hypothetical protein
MADVPDEMLFVTIGSRAFPVRLPANLDPGMAAAAIRGDDRSAAEATQWLASQGGWLPIAGRNSWVRVEAVQMVSVARRDEAQQDA